MSPTQTRSSQALTTMPLSNQIGCRIHPLWVIIVAIALLLSTVPAFPRGVTPFDIADGGVRLIGRRTSKDGRTWSDPTRLVMTPVSWTGGTVAPDSAAKVRFVLKRVFLYGFATEEK